MIHDPGIVNRGFEQRGIEHSLVLICEPLSDLLAHARTLQGQVLSSELLLREFEDVPLAAVETSRLCVIANLHRSEQI